MAARRRLPALPNPGRLPALTLAVLAFALLAAAPAVRALDPQKSLTQYGHEVWTTEHGLPQNSIQGVVQTTDGYIWLATQEGVVRFDGVRFTVFDKRSLPLMKSNNVLCLCGDPRGGLWIGLETGGALRYRDGVFSPVGRAEGLQAERIDAIYADPAGAVWFGTDNAGLERYENGRFRSFTAKDGLVGAAVYALYRDHAGTLWVATSRGLCRMEGDRFVSFPFAEKERNWYYALAEDAGGTLWVGTLRGLYAIRDGKARLLTEKDGLASVHIQSLYYEAAQDTLWVGTYGGLTRLRGGAAESYTSREGLSNDTVWSLTGDQEGSLWIGTLNGLNRFRDTKFVNVGVREGLLNDVVDAVCEARDGSLWIGTDSGGVTRYRDGHSVSYSVKEGLPSETVNTVFEDREGTIWAGVDVGGLARFENGRFEKVFPRQVALANTSITCMGEDAAGDLWVGASNGLYRIRGSRCTAYGTKDGMPSESVMCILDDGAGGLWVGTDAGGLLHYRDGKFTALTKKAGLADNIVYALYRDASGALWVGTPGGLCRYKDGRFGTITTRQGLFDDTAYVILEDARSNLWMSCNKGVFRASRKALEEVAEGRASSVQCDAYGRSDGMGSTECNGGVQPSGWERRDGRLCFATMKGVAIIDPANVKINRRPPPVVIEAVLVDGHPLPTGEEPRLKPGRHRMEIRFSALSLVAPEKVKFKYRLDGYDAEWQEGGARREAVYTGIPQGEYTFRVIACNNDGIWNERGASFRFIQRPHFYQRLGFILLCVFCGLALSAGGVGLRVNRLKARQARLEALVAERTAQLAEANDALKERGAELEVANLKLQRLSQLDGLTGIANRRHFEEVMDVEWRRGCRTRTSLAVVMIDVDCFKPFNDTYGHQAGDECLRRVSAALAESLHRAGDLVGRYGGDEFVAVLPGMDAENALVFAEALRARIEALAIPTRVSDVAPVVTASLGVAACVPREGAAANDLLDTADKALYRSKEAGKNRVSGTQITP